MAWGACVPLGSTGGKGCLVAQLPSLSAALSWMATGADGAIPSLNTVLSKARCERFPFVRRYMFLFLMCPKKKFKPWVSRVQATEKKEKEEKKGVFFGSRPISCSRGPLFVARQVRCGSFVRFRTASHGAQQKMGVGEQSPRDSLEDNPEGSTSTFSAVSNAIRQTQTAV